MICGRIKCNKNELDLPLTLLGGQSFRWKQKINEKNTSTSPNVSSVTNFIGVMSNSFWEIQQNDDFLEYKVQQYSSDPSNKSTSLSENICNDILYKYFRLDFNLKGAIEKWKLASEHFDKITKNFSSARLLDQEPLENIISFICSQNNNITRISSMIEWLCCKYGNKICTYDDVDYYTFPTLQVLHNVKNLETELRNAKFGYRAKYISKAINEIQQKGGNEWIQNLKSLSYKETRCELLKITGIGPKVADCICLMSLGHLEAVPIDTHIYKISQQHHAFDKVIGKRSGKSKDKPSAMTSVMYEKIGDMFRDIYNPYAGWAQLVLFCSDLKKFKEKL